MDQNIITDGELNAMSDDQLTRLANGESLQSVIPSASQPRAVRDYTDDELNAMSDDELARIANGESTVPVAVVENQQTHAQTSIQTQDDGLPMPQKPAFDENDSPTTAGFKEFFSALFSGSGRERAYNRLQADVQNGGAGMATAGYLADLGNSFYSGLIGGGTKIAEAAGHIVGSDGLVHGARDVQNAADTYFRTDATDTAQNFDANGKPIERSWGKRIADEGKNVMRMAGEFAPAALGGPAAIGTKFGALTTAQKAASIFTAANIGAGGVNRYNQLVDEAQRNGLSKAQARMIGSAGGAIDAFSNAFLMGKFRKTGVAPIEERFFKSFIARQLAGAAKTAGVMGVGAGAQNVLDQMAANGDFDIKATGNAVLDAAIQGAMFHVMNEALHAPVKWSDAKKARAVQRHDAEKDAVNEQNARDAAEIERQRNELLENDLAIKNARAVLNDPQGVAEFIRQNQDIALDMIAARRRGEDVDMAALLSDGVDGISPVLRPAFQTQGDANAFADRLLQYSESREESIRKFRERLQEKNALGKAQRRMERANQAAHDERAKGIAEAFNEADERAADLGAMVDANKGRETKAAQKDYARTENERETVNAEADRLDAERAELQDRAVEDDAARHDAEVEAREGDAVARFREKYGIKPYDEWRGGKPDSKAMRWAYDRLFDKAVRMAVDEGDPLGNKVREEMERTSNGFNQRAIMDAFANGGNGNGGNGNGGNTGDSPTAPTSPIGPTSPVSPTAPINPTSPSYPTSPDSHQTPEGSSGQSGGNTSPNSQNATTAQGMRESAYQAWLAKRSTYRTFEGWRDTPTARKLFDNAVRRGEVDPQTGKYVEDCNFDLMKVINGESKLGETPELESETKMFDLEAKEQQKIVDNDKYLKLRDEQMSREDADDGLWFRMFRNSNSLEKFLQNSWDMIREQRRIIDDWRGRVYKEANFDVKFAGKGEDAGFDIKSNAGRINEKRRKKAISGCESEIKRIKDIVEDVARRLNLDKEDIEESKFQDQSSNVSSSASEPTDAGFRAWLGNGKDGQPLVLNGEELKQSRALFDDLVRRGKVNGATGENIQERAESHAQTQTADENSTGRRYVDRIVFDKPYVGKTGAKLVAYEWANKKIEEVDRRGDNVVRKVSDWDEAIKNPDTNRDIVHHFTVIDANGETHVVSASTAAKMLGISEGAVRLNALSLAKKARAKIEAEKSRIEEVKQRSYELSVLGNILTKTQQDVFKRMYRSRWYHGDVDDEQVHMRKDGTLVFFDNDGFHVDIHRDGSVDKFTREDGIDKFKLEGDLFYVGSVKNAKPVNENDVGQISVLKALGAKAAAASRRLKAYASLGDRELISYREKLVRAGRTDDVQAVDDLLVYRKATAEVPQQSPDVRMSRSVGEVEEDGGRLVETLTERLSRVVPGLKAKVAPATDAMNAKGASAQFDRKTAEVHIDPNAPWSDAVHEISGHAVRMWAEKHCPSLIRKAVEYAMNAPKDIKEYVFRNYADKDSHGNYVYDGDALLDEIFAHRFAREHKDLFRKMLNEKPAVKHWWTNITNAVRSVFQDAAKRNGVDVEKLKGLGAEEYVKGVAEQLALGKSLNEWTAYGKDKGYFANGVEIGAGDGTRNARNVVTPEEDKAYMDAAVRIADAMKVGKEADKKDVETAQRMVREAAAKAMPGSKVVDKDGLPMVVWHGTNSQFNSFDVGKIGKFDNGTKMDWSGEEPVAVKDDMFFFTSSKDEAKSHADGAVEIDGGKGRVIGVFVSAKNPLVKEVDKFHAERKYWDAQQWYDINTAELQKEIGKTGSDALIVRNPVRENDILVGTKNPNAIKSADPVTYDDAGNVIPLSKRFQMNNPDIRYSRRADAKPYDERTEDGRKYNEKYADARIGDAAVSRRAVDALGDGGRELDAALAARRANASEATRGVLRYSRGELGDVAGVDENIRQHEKMRFGDGTTRKRGMETIAVVRDGDSVYKYRTAQTGLENERTNVARHNELFGDRAPYEIVDFASDDGGNVLVVRQPHIDLMPKSGNLARKQLEADLRKRFGAVDVRDGGMEMRAGDWIIDDLKDANIGIDRKTGMYAVIDALIHRADEVPNGEGAKAKGRVVYAGNGEGGEQNTIAQLKTETANNDGVYGGEGSNGAGVRYSRGLEFYDPNGKLNEKEIRDGYERASELAGDKFKKVEEILGNVGSRTTWMGEKRIEDGGREKGEESYSKRIVDALGESGLIIAEGVDANKWVEDHTSGLFRDGSRYKVGSEAIAFADGDSVAKIRVADGPNRMIEGESQYISDFNFLFGKDSAYSLDGYIIDKNGRIREVIRQRMSEYEEGKSEDAYLKLLDELRRRFGDLNLGEDDNVVIGNKSISDITSDNVGIDIRTGKPFVRDCDIHTLNDDGSIRYSRSLHPVDPALPSDKKYMDREREKPEAAKFEYMRNMADRYYPVKDIVRDAMRANGATKEDAEKFATNDAASPYHQKRVQSGLAEKDFARVRGIERGLENDLKGLSKEGLDILDLGAWGYATHAEARNAQKLADHGVIDGSGISDAKAQDILNGRQFDLGGKTKQYTPAQMAALENARKRIVHRINGEFGLDYLHKAGLIDASSVARLKRAYGDDWVSLKDDITEDGVDYGNSTSVANPLMKAKGRTSELEDNPIVTTLVGSMANIANAKKNIAYESLARFVEAHPEMGEVRPMTPVDRMDPSRIVFRRNVIDPNTGEERNIKMLITLNGKRGAEIARSFTDADVLRGPQWMQTVTRKWAAFATQLSPTFSVRNFLKDTMEVFNDTLSTQGVGAAANFLKQQVSLMPLWNKEFRGVLKEWRENGTVTGTSQIAQDFKKFVDSGALIGGMGREGYATENNYLKSITENVPGIKGQAKKIGAMWNAYVDWIGGVNESVEMLTRFNNFRNRIARGETVEEAAINSREGSTDFGMYGNQRWMNSVWMFSNSILGGTMRAGKSMITGKYGRRVLAGMIAMGFLEEMANSAMNADDDEKSGEPTEKDVTEYDRENKLRFRFGGKMVTVPMHFGPFSVLKYAGGNLYRAMSGQIDWDKAAWNVVNAAVKVGSHLTATGEHGFSKDDPDLVPSLMPTAVVQPLVQVGYNQDYKGDPIYKEHNLGNAKYAPDWKYAKNKTSKAWVEISRALNNLPLGGGSDLVKGKFSVPPEVLEYLSKQVFKNFGTDVVNTAVETPRAAIETMRTGENKFETKNVLFVRDVVKDATDVSQMYYELSEEHRKEHQAFNATKGMERREYLREHPTAGYKLDKREKAIKRMQALARGEILNKDGKKVGEREISAAQKEMYEAKARRMMSDYIRIIRK